MDSIADTPTPVHPGLGIAGPARLKQMTPSKPSQDLLKDHPNQSAFLTVLRQEINRFDRLLGIIHWSLSSLRLAVKGEVLMSEELEETYDALLSNRVPSSWRVSVYLWPCFYIPRTTFITITHEDIICKNKR